MLFIEKHARSTITYSYKQENHVTETNLQLLGEKAWNSLPCGMTKLLCNTFNVFDGSEICK